MAVTTVPQMRNVDEPEEGREQFSGSIGGSPLNVKGQR